jgi:hypothetical protein
MRSETKSSIDVDNRLLTLSRLLRDFFLRSRQSLDSFFESRPTVDSWSSFKKKVNRCNYDDRPRSRLLTLTDFFEDFEAILYEFFHFPTEKSTAKSTKSRRLTICNYLASCNNCDFFLNKTIVDSWSSFSTKVDSMVNFFDESRQFIV